MGTRCDTRCTDLPAGQTERACSGGRDWCVDVGAPGDVGAGRDQPVVEQVAHGLLQAHVDQLDGLGEMSMPIQRRPRFSAATQAVAQPQKGSSTTSPSLDDALMMRSRRARGFWVGYPIRSLPSTAECRPTDLAGGSRACPRRSASGGAFPFLGGSTYPRSRKRLGSISSKAQYRPR